VLLLGLSSAHKLGLGLTAAVFAGFSLVVAMVLPRRWPQFPGRGLPAFLVIVVALFLGMLAAVEIFGKESKEAEAAGAKSETTTTAPSSGAQRVAVRESEFKIQLPKTTLAAGTYTFAVANDGKIQHNLVVTGPGGRKGTSTIAPGSSATLTVKLEKGSYDFYCSIPGHKSAGMDQKVTVS
jgi:plastocyanin